MSPGRGTDPAGAAAGRETSPGRGTDDDGVTGAGRAGAAAAAGREASGRGTLVRVLSARAIGCGTAGFGGISIRCMGRGGSGARPTPIVVRSAPSGRVAPLAIGDDSDVTGVRGIVGALVLVLVLVVVVVVVLVAA